VAEGIAEMRGLCGAGFQRRAGCLDARRFRLQRLCRRAGPWTLRKTDPARMEAVLMVLLRVVRDLAIAVRPVVPTAIDKLLDQMGWRQAQRLSPPSSRIWLAIWLPGLHPAQPVGVFPA
jgi:methionyl-tRNA synthetase